MILFALTATTKLMVRYSELGRYIVVGFRFAYFVGLSRLFVRCIIRLYFHVQNISSAHKIFIPMRYLYIMFSAYVS